MTILRLVPVTPDLIDHPPIVIDEEGKNKELILGRGKLTNIHDIKVSRKQVYAFFHAADDTTPAHMSITVKGAKPSYVLRNQTPPETIEVAPFSQEKVYDNDLLYLLRDKFAYRFEVLPVDDEEEPALKKRKIENNETPLSELEQLQQDHENLKMSSAKQIRTLNSRLQEKSDAAQKAEVALGTLERKNLNLERMVEKLQRQIKDIKSDKPDSSSSPSKATRRSRAARRDSRVEEDDYAMEDSIDTFAELTYDEDTEMGEDLSSENDELEDDELKKLEEKAVQSWVDRSGQICRWIGPAHQPNGNLNKFYDSVLIEKRMFSVGDFVLTYSPRGFSSFVGKIIALYQTPLNKRRVQLQWFYSPDELSNAVDVFSARDLKPYHLIARDVIGSSQVDSNDVSVLEKHCSVRMAIPASETPNIASSEIISWAKGSTSRFFCRYFFDSTANEITYQITEPAKRKYNYPDTDSIRNEADVPISEK